MVKKRSFYSLSVDYNIEKFDIKYISTATFIKIKD